MLSNYGVIAYQFIVFCDNTSAINILKNPIQHSHTKHIDIKHHFIKDLVEDKTLTLDILRLTSRLLISS